MIKEKCITPGCDGKVYAAKWCLNCYNTARNANKPNIMRMLGGIDYENKRTPR